MRPPADLTTNTLTVRAASDDTGRRMDSWIRWTFVWVAFTALIAVDTCRPKDSTDPAAGRSGMGLYIDSATGCHYLGRRFGTLVPRLDAGGDQICTGYAGEAELLTVAEGANDD